MRTLHPLHGDPNRACGPFSRAALATILLAAAAAAAPAEASDWTLGREADGITVHTRPVANSGVREFRGRAEVEAPVDSILGLLRDSSRFKTWFPNTPESRLLERDGPVSYQYSVMATPWPISDRDNVLRSTRRTDPTSGVVTIDVEAAPDFHPEQPDRVRVRRARGRWTLEPLDARRTRVTFQMHLEPGGGIPEWMVNTRVVETPFEALANLRKTVER
jgi:hypothetical protein